MPAPSMVASAHADYTTTTASKSVNIAVEAGDLLVVLVACEDHATTVSEPSTAGLTYVLHNGTTAVSHCRTYIYWARATTTGTVAVAATASSTSHLWGFSVLRYRNVLQIGTSAGTIGSGAPSLAFTTTMYESTIVEIIADWNGNDGVARVWRDINAAPAIERRYARTASRFGVYVGSWNWTGAVGAKTTGLTAPSMTAWTASALELQGTPIPATVTATAEAQDATVATSGLGHVQQVTGQSGNSSTGIALTLPSAPTPGNLLVFAMGGDKNTGALDLPGFAQVVPDLLGSSVSLYYYWKVSDGTERTINPSWAAVSQTGNMAWYAEYADSSVPGSTWDLIGVANHLSDNSTTTSWATGTTEPVQDSGLGIAVAAVDSNSSVTVVDPWGNGYTTRYSSTGGSGRGAVFVAEKQERPEEVPVSTDRAPGQTLNIGPGDGQNHFSVQVAPNGASVIASHTEAEIAAGYDEDPYFTSTPDSEAVQFWARMDGPTTVGTSQARAELRELNLLGSNMSFDPNTGEHWMRGKTRITHLPPNKPEAVVAQLHNGDADRIVIRTQLISGQIKLLCRINGTSSGLPRFAEVYVPGTEFEWMIKVVDGAISVFYNDMVTPLITAPAGTLAPTGGVATWYFKAGCYNQSDETTDDPLEWCSAELRHLQHWHTGWPAVQPFPEKPTGTVFAGASSAFNYTGTADQASAALAVFAKLTPSSVVEAQAQTAQASLLSTAGGRAGVAPPALPAMAVAGRRNLVVQPQGGNLWFAGGTGGTTIEAVPELDNPPPGTGITQGMRAILGPVSTFGEGAYGSGPYSSAGTDPAVSGQASGGYLAVNDLREGQWFSFSAYLRVNATRDVRVTVDWRGPESTIILSQGISVPTTAGVWARPFITLQAPPGATRAAVVCISPGAGTSVSGQVVEWAGVLVESVEPGASEDLYFDGSTPGGTWEGAAFNSSSVGPLSSAQLVIDQGRTAEAQTAEAIAEVNPTYAANTGDRRVFPDTATAAIDGASADERVAPAPFTAEPVSRAEALDGTVEVTGDAPIPAPTATATAAAQDASVQIGREAQAQTAQATTDASPTGRTRSVEVNAEMASADAFARGVWHGKGAEPPLSLVEVIAPPPTYYDAKQPPVVEFLVEALEPSWRISHGDALQLQPVGFEVRVISADDYTTVLAVLTEWIELVIGPELSAAGNGSITLDMDSPFWLTTLPGGLPAESILDREHLFEVWEEGQLRFPFFGTVVKENLLEESGSRGVSISGPGIAEVLSWGRVFSPGFPTPTAAKWVFNPVGGTDPIVTMAGAWLQLLDAAKGRGSAVARVQPTFTAEKDSQGVDWPDKANRFEWIPELGPTLLEVLDTVTGQVSQVQTSLTADWRMDPGFKLHMAPELGQDRSAQVIFHDNNSTKVRNRTRQRDEIYNYVVVRDTTGAYSLKQDPLSQTTWGLREWIELQHDQVEETNRDKVAQVLLDQRKDEKSEWVIRVQYGIPGRMPFKDFQLGDQVGVQVYKPVGVDPLTGEISGGTSVVEKHRVLAIVLRVDSQENVDMELTLQSRFQSKAKQLFREMTKVMRIVRQP